MNALTRPAHVLFYEARREHFIGRVLLAALLYFSFSTLIINFRAIQSILVLPYSLFIKIKILSTLITGAAFAYSSFDLIVLCTLSLLFGINLVLAHRTFARQKKRFSLSLGTGIFSTVAVGCTSCGFSVLSLFGVGSALAALPLAGTAISFFTISALVFSIGYTLMKSTACSGVSAPFPALEPAVT